MGESKRSARAAMGENKTENRQKGETERGEERQESVNKGGDPDGSLGVNSLSG